MKKKLQKNRRAPGWKFVMIAAGVCVLAVLVAGIAFLCMWLKNISLIADLANWQAGAINNYKEVQVSDDANWFQIPDERIRFAFFVPDKIGKYETQPLRYRHSIMGSGLENVADRGFEIFLTYDLLDDWSGTLQDFPDGCVNPFVLLHSTEAGGWTLADSTNIHAQNGYEKITDITLADGRVVTLGKNKSESCKEYSDDALGQALIQRLSKIESY